MHPQKNYVATKLKAFRTLQSKLQRSTFDRCNPSTHREEKWREVGIRVSSCMTTIVCTLLTNTKYSKRGECWQHLQMWCFANARLELVHNHSTFSHILLSSKSGCRLVRADCTFFFEFVCLFLNIAIILDSLLVTERFWYSSIPKDTNQSLTYIPNQFLSVHWSRRENSKQRIFSRLKKVYPTTSDMLSWARLRQLWNLSTCII